MIRKYFPFCFYVLVSVLCLGKPSLAYPAGNLGGRGVTHAVTSTSETDYITIDSITPLKIGDKIPEELWEMHFPVVSPHSDNIQYLSLGDFRDKLIILDFWATWCAPCISSFPDLMDLQEEFSETLFILPITRDDVSRLRPFIEKFTDNYGRAFAIPTVSGSTVLHELFPHKTIPHYVIIKKGLVESVTTGDQINRGNIQKLIEGGEVAILTKNEDLNFDADKPFFVGGNGGDGANIKFRSTLSGPIEGVGRSATVLDPMNKRLLTRATTTNASIVQMFKMAYYEASRFPDNRIIIEVSDSYPKSKFEDPYSYELMMPAASVSDFRDKMIADLQEYFGLTASIVRREVECWVMDTNENINKSYSGGDGSQSSSMVPTPNGTIIRNERIDRIADLLDWKLELPVFSDTEESRNIDITLPINTEDVDMLHKALNAQGLELHKEKRTVDIFLITDNKK